jgi:hypothetical protein
VAEAGLVGSADEPEVPLRIDTHALDSDALRSDPARWP